MTETLIAYLHYMAMSLIAVFLALEHQVCVPGLTHDRIRLLARIDLLYLSAVFLALATGLARLIWFGKGAGFYLHNPVFYIKLALFLAIGMISIPPTMQYLRWTRALRSGYMNVVQEYEVMRVRRYVLAELVLFGFVPLMAVFMARGIGAQLPAG